ncbi:hypothetical protein ASE78_16780 [Sphingomonas sp. Leaf25]|nr:hypothetical protein ASE78_16780 [Sphingomonas sp. Leaf25]
MRSLPPDRVGPVERMTCMVGRSVDGIRDWGPDVRSAKAGRAAWLYAHCATDDAIARDVNLDLRDVEALTGPFAPDTLRKPGCPPPPGDEPVRGNPPLRIVQSPDACRTPTANPPEAVPATMVRPRIPVDFSPAATACVAMLRRRGYAVLGRGADYAAGCDGYRTISLADRYRDPPPRGDRCYHVDPSLPRAWGNDTAAQTSAVIDLYAQCRMIAQIAADVDLSQTAVRRIVERQDALIQTARAAHCGSGRARPVR